MDDNSIREYSIKNCIVYSTMVHGFSYYMNTLFQGQVYLEFHQPTVLTIFGTLRLL